MKPGPVISKLKNEVILSFLRKFLRNLIGFPKMVINRLSLVRIGPHWSALDNYGWIRDKKHMSWFSKGYYRLTLVRIYGIKNI